jgi:hypothetical protein
VSSFHITIPSDQNQPADGISKPSIIFNKRHEKRASEFKQASIESKSYLESLEQQKKQTNKMLYCETRKAENKLHYNERGLEYSLAFNKLSEDFNNYVQNVKNDYTKDPQNKKSSQYNSQEMAI